MDINAMTMLCYGYTYGIIVITCHDFYNIIFKIKPKLYIAYLSASCLPPSKQFLLRTCCRQFLSF